MPAQNEIKALVAFPARLSLRGSDDAKQVLITAELNAGRMQDLTGDVKYEVADPRIARVTSTGRVLPKGNGSTQITAHYGERKASFAIAVESVDENLPINFGNQIVPIFTKLGCNSGGCHGKLSGQNGFRLSLLGFEPDLDYTTLVKESRGRRLFLAAPEQSLLLRKASGQLSHGGGKRMEPDSDEYKLIRRWIASGLPYGNESDPVVTKLEVVPPARVLSRQNKQQFIVYAHYSDGSMEDVTRRAQYDTNDPEVAIVEPTGLVRSLNLSGEAAIMARYLGQVNSIRVTVPLGVKIPDYRFEAKSVVDQATQKKWQLLGIVPSELCTDEQFIRRVSIDITGTLPTPAEVEAFLGDPSADRRDKLVDRLLAKPEYAYFFANKWADILRVKRGNQQPGRAYGTFAFHDWLVDAIAADRPYDQFVREILSAVGDEACCPPTVWYKDLQTADQFVDNASQVFLGTRMQCAQCHHHPYEKWSQDDYWGLAAFFGRLAVKNVPIAGRSNQNQQNQKRVLSVKATGSVTNKKSGKSAVMKPLDGEPVTVGPEDDPRLALVDWMVDPHNPFFARAVVNRYWGHFLGRGIVDPIDDMRVTNPPSNAELLDALAKDLADHRFSLKHLIGTICKSRTYQLSSTPNEFNKNDKQAYSRYYAKRLQAEVLFDAVCQVTDSPPSFPGLPQDIHAPKRAIMLPDESFASYFLDVFGRPQRLSACECERVTEPNLAQALHLLNSEEVQNKISRGGGRAELFAKDDKRSDEEKITELFEWCFTRKPTEKHLQLALEHIQRHGKDKKRAYEDILWALVNTKEFIFNR